MDERRRGEKDSLSLSLAFFLEKLTQHLLRPEERSGIASFRNSRNPETQEGSVQVLSFQEGRNSGQGSDWAAVGSGEVAAAPTAVIIIGGMDGWEGFMRNRKHNTAGKQKRG